MRSFSEIQIALPFNISPLYQFKRIALGFAGAILQQPGWGGLLRASIEKRSMARKFPPRLVRRERSPFQILVYHRVLKAYDPFAVDAITVDAFEKHLMMLSRLFRLITVEQLMQELENGGVQPHTICLTFDDGYRDNFENAFPLLQKHGVPATIFLTTDFIGTDEQLWHDQVLLALQDADCKRLNFDAAQLTSIDLGNPENRRKIAFKILSWLKQFTPEVRDRHISQLCEICRVAAVNRHRLMLSWDEVRLMHKRGVAFGAHTKTHPILSTLGEEQLKNEITGSKAAIEEALDTPISGFAYPNGKPGDFNEQVKQALRQAEFRCAVTTSAGVNTNGQDPFELFRTMPWDPDPNRLLGRLLYERFTG